MSDAPRPADIGPPPAPIPHIPRCRKPGPDREPEGLRLWTVDMCANVVFNVAKRPVEHYPPGAPIPRRRWEFLSVRPIRAYWRLPDGGGEVCRRQYGRLVRFPDRSWRVIFCTRPAPGMTRFSVGQFFKEPTKRKSSSLGRPVPIGQREKLKETGIQPGRGGYVASYLTPFWTETIVHSAVRLCEPVQE